MLTKNNNILSYKNTSNNTKKQNKNLKFNSKTSLKSNITKKNKINYQNPKLTLQKEALKPKNIKLKNNNDTNKNINKSKYRLFSSGTQNLENKKNLNKNKKNNVTNNICIIIKTSNHKEPEEDKTLRNIQYYDSLKNILNYPMTTGHFGAKNLKQNYSFKNQRTYNEKRMKYNNSFTRRSSNSEKEKKKKSFNRSINAKINLLKRKKQLVNTDNKRIDSGTTEIFIDFKNEPINNIYKNNNCLSPNNITIQNNKYSEFRSLLFSNIAENHPPTNRNDYSSVTSKSKKSKNKYKQSILLKKELFGINLDDEEKKEVDQKLLEEFIEKKKEEIERKILINDEIIKNEERMKDNHEFNQKMHKRIFSDDISINPYKFETTSNENNISKSDISNLQTEYNRDNNNKCTKLVKNNFTTRNNKKAINARLQKGKSNISKKNTKYLNYKQSLNSLYNKNENNNINKQLSSNTSLVTNKSCMDLFIQVSKIKKNTDIIMNDIMKIMNTNKSKNKLISPKKIREKLFSPPPKDEIILVQNNEDGKTLRYIKKRCKEKSKLNSVEKNDKKDLNDKNENEKNDRIETLPINYDNKKEQIKEDNKKLEIKIGQQIEALRRIKLTIENYKNAKVKCKNISPKKLKKNNTFSSSYIIRDNKISSQIRRLNSLQLETKRDRFFSKLQ
jgi:hypothetical protein